MSIPHSKLIGLIETVKVKGVNGSKDIIARIDTGADKSSIDESLVRELCLGPVLRHRNIKSASGRSIRAVIKARVEVAGKKFKFAFTVADRRHMKYKMLIGLNILKRGFIIDPLLYHMPTRIKKKA